jgi:hypothetical protein
MSKSVSYKRHRFPPEIIAHAVRLYFRFPLSRNPEKIACSVELSSHTLPNPVLWEAGPNRARS